MYLIATAYQELNEPDSDFEVDAVLVTALRRVPLEINAFPAGWTSATRRPRLRTWHLSWRPTSTPTPRHTWTTPVRCRRIHHPHVNGYGCGIARCSFAATNDHRVWDFGPYRSTTHRRKIQTIDGVATERSDEWPSC